MKKLILIGILLLRIFTNDGWVCDKRNSKVKTQPVETFRFIRRPSRKGRKKFKLHHNIFYNSAVCQQVHYIHR